MFRWLRRLFKRSVPKKKASPKVQNRVPKKAKKPIAKVPLSLYTPPELREHYIELWESSHYLEDRYMELITLKILENYNSYYKIQDETGVPWEVVATVHNMECSLNFSKCLHNGQSWKKKTTWVPKGLGPWRSFEDAAIDALNRKRSPDYWSIENTLYYLEKYNGLGYLKYHSSVNSPYLWSKTNHYSKGKYTSDGKFDYNAVSKQIGAVVILKQLKYKGGEDAVEILQSEV